MEREIVRLVEIKEGAFEARTHLVMSTLQKINGATSHKDQTHIKQYWFINSHAHTVPYRQHLSTIQTFV